MIALEFHFPAGRYHATPWDSQVNEGLVEWPPSPWRILRALISTWYFKARQEIEEGDLTGLIGKLSERLPAFSLPTEQLSLAHTRHYMPLYRTIFDGKTTKVFDTFIRLVDRGPLIAVWSTIELDEHEKRCLAILVERIGYLGRAESWAEGQVRESFMGHIGAAPCLEEESLSPGEEILRLLAPLTEQEYQIWRQDYLKGLHQAGKKGMPSKMMLPATVFEAMQLDTATMKAQGWNQPPGSRYVLYRRPKLEPEIRFRAVSAPRKVKSYPTVARFALTSTVPPRLTEAVSVAERIRTALMSRSDAARVFAGKDGTGAPLRLGHQHTHVFCESYGVRGEITHVTLYAPLGFDEEAMITISGLEKVWGRGGYDLQLVYLGCWHPQDFAGLRAERAEFPLFATSETWISITPFVPTRLPKYNRNRKPRLDENGLHIGSPEHDLRRLLSLAGKPDPKSVEFLEFTYLGSKKITWLEFMRGRMDDPARDRRLGYGFRIVFPKPVSGPIALGYGCHYGLGLFVPA
jgi:CRISPR-associated protein Csb2